MESVSCSGRHLNCSTPTAILNIQQWALEQDANLVKYAKLLVTEGMPKWLDIHGSVRRDKQILTDILKLDRA